MAMTSLQPDSDRITEIAMLPADSQPAAIATGPRRSVHPPADARDAHDARRTSTHAKTGLIERVRASDLAEREAESQALEFLAAYVPANTSPMCGNSICQDRRFLARWMPRLEAYFHYRNLDVSTLKEL